MLDAVADEGDQFVIIELNLALDLDLTLWRYEDGFQPRSDTQFSCGPFIAHKGEIRITAERGDST